MVKVVLKAVAPAYFARDFFYQRKTNRRNLLGVIMADERNKIRVFIFSKQSLLRSGLEYSLSVAKDVEISEAAEFSEDVHLFETMNPNLSFIKPLP
jgi:hypothetical protein